MMQVMEERSDSLDEAFLSNCFAYIKKTSEDGMLDVVYVLQKILQLYAARKLGQAEPQGTEDALLADILSADESVWESMLEELVQSGVHYVAWHRGRHDLAALYHQVHTVHNALHWVVHV
jgi:hypothetical protein